MINLMIGDRGCGKTTRLIKRSAEEHLVIITASNSMRDFISDMAIQMGYDIPKPMSVADLNNNAYEHHGMRRRDAFELGVLIDDLELVLHALLHGVTIKEATVGMSGVSIYEINETEELSTKRTIHDGYKHRVKEFNKNMSK